MKNLYLCLFLCFGLGLNPILTTAQTNLLAGSGDYLVKISQEFLYAARTEDSASISAHLDTLARLEKIAFETEAQQMSFWLNLYNGYIQTELRQNPEKYQKRSKFFARKFIRLAGKKLSLDMLEHGILRRGRMKISLGYLPKIFLSRTEKKWRVPRLDARIHWGLNCGAASCPPILYYRPESLPEQLALAEKAFLSADCVYIPAQNKVQVPRIFSWFRADFGGKKGIRQILKRLGIIPSDSQPKIEFLPYDWGLYLDNFKN
jgi:hypothetical protein